jgi:6-phosphofructokinase 1
MLKRKAIGKEYGIVVLAEGLIEGIGVRRLEKAMDELARQMDYPTGAVYGKIELDPHGHPRLGEIEFAKMVKDALTVYGAEFGIKSTYVDKDLGYELRCADPIPFDVEYTRNLGYCAVKYLLSDRPEDRDGALISFHQGKMLPMHFSEIFKTRDRLPTRKVEIHGEIYEVARHYMHRLEPRDFDQPETLARIAQTAGKTPDQIRERFGYLIGRGPTPWQDD